MQEPDIAGNLETVRNAITEACAQFGRDPASVNLLAVSKTKPVALLHAAMAAGQYHFGENYLQEALEKIEAIDDPAVQWHYIGAIQSNKTRQIAGHFDWVHTVASAKVARRLSDQRPDNLPPLKVLVQVNISSEASKAGVAPADAPALVAEMADLPRLEIRGLMAIPAPAPDESGQRAEFAALRMLRDRIREEMGSKLPAFTDLSMGMSADMSAAIAEGATWLRIGTAIFGSRD